MQIFIIVNEVLFCRLRKSLSLVGKAGGGFGSRIVLVNWLYLE